MSLIVTDYGYLRASLIFYDILERSKNMDELNRNLEDSLDWLNMAALDVAKDNGWDEDEVETL